MDDPAPFRRRRLLRWLAAAGAFAAAAGARGAAAAATVAAASDLKFALEELALQFARAGGAPPRLVFGSSGQFVAQILQGAPFHLFLSADEDLVFRLADAGRTEDRGAVYAIGRLALVVPHGSALRADGTLADLAAALRDGRLRRFAIANPEHAPYGQRAEEALRHAGLWEAIRPRLVYGENIAQASQFAIAGGADGGLVALSLALAPELARRGRHALVDAHRHRPLVQRMVLLKGAPPAARGFHDFLGTPAARTTLARHGFGRPEGG